ncbi:hypothetical protein EUGRSUZ_K03400 [Eucalyptus grandis]|uniref:Uncharacterized protein n=2 Tax=Eucalyptus grandis TaxID=71139 RepID=A0A059A817_EUCGR|nr:hypothetical protein EUGRSUZ_K03400 [Eucalyptus grandis]
MPLRLSIVGFKNSQGAFGWAFRKPFSPESSLGKKKRASPCTSRNTRSSPHAHSPKSPHDDADFRSVNDNLQHLQNCRRKIRQLAIRLLPPSDTTTPTIASARFPASSHVFPLLVGSKVWVVAVSSAQIPASRSLPRGEAEQHMIH